MCVNNPPMHMATWTSAIASATITISTSAAAVPSTSCTLSSAPVAAWIGAELGDVWILGPDEESAQWADAVAGALSTDRRAIVLTKDRRGDRDRARDYYRRFVDLWADGDLDGEHVRAAQTALDRL